MISGIKKGLIGATGILVVTAGLGFSSPAFAEEGVPDNTTLGPGQYSGAPTTNDDWSCDMMATGHYAPCKQDTPTTGDEAWYKGYKLTFNWQTPLDWQGNPYQRCVLAYYNPATAYNAESMAPIQIDVPGSWSSYTIPLERYGWLEDGIQAGATTLKEEYYCYTDGVGSSARTDSNSAIIPDMPPTTPTNVDATADDTANVTDTATAVTVTTGGTDLSGATTSTSNDSDVSLQVSGSKALGVSPLDGYQLDVTNTDTGATVADVNIAPQSAGSHRVVAGASKGSNSRLNAAFSKVRNLKPGTYSVKVASYNRIGASDPYTMKLVVKKGGKVTTVKTATAKVKGKKVTAKWSAVKNSGGYVVQALRGSKIVKQVKVGAKVHATTLSLTKGSYTVRISNLDKQRASTPKIVKVRIR